MCVLIQWTLDMSNFDTLNTLVCRKKYFLLDITIHLAFTLILMSKGFPEDLRISDIFQCKKGIFLEKSPFSYFEINLYISKNLLHFSLCFSAVDMATAQALFEPPLKIPITHRAFVTPSFSSCAWATYASHLSHYSLFRDVFSKLFSIY